jgi:hypothetical protein
MGTHTYGNPQQSDLYRNAETSQAENCNVNIKQTKIRMIKANEEGTFFAQKFCFCKTAMQQMSAVRPLIRVNFYSSQDGK